jgi:hypothetical protein
MTCPFCVRDGRPERVMSIRELHAHLAGDHPGEIVTEPLGERIVYVVTCPHCGERYRQQMRKTAGDAGFVDEFEHQIRLVAFDMLINHLLAEHDPELFAPPTPTQ